MILCPLGALGGGVIHSSLFEEIISVENLFLAWEEFKRGKTKKQDIAVFAAHLEENIFALHAALAGRTYRHGSYTHFVVRDPKPRDIHKAPVHDRLLHHAVTRVLTPLFEPQFICDSYSSRTGKGVHAAVNRFQKFAWRLSRNNTRTVWVLKCDVQKFFDSVDHEILLGLCAKRILDARALSLVHDIVHSFEFAPGKGIPLGNVTSQLFSNVYLHPFDEFVKRELRVRCYVRYADDFLVLGCNKNEMSGLISSFSAFLEDRLALRLHAHKVVLHRWHSGVDFLGYVQYPQHRVLRTKTKRRMQAAFLRACAAFCAGNVSAVTLNQIRQSYLGIARHCKGAKVRRKVNKTYYSLRSQ